MIVVGSSDELGASWDGAGVNFALYSEHASLVELCLFGTDGQLVKKYELPDCKAGVWNGYVPDCHPGQHYGYRVRGDYRPEKGLYFNPHKLLIDPYAKQLSGPLTWDRSVYGYETGSHESEQLQIDRADSAAFVPKGIVQGKSTVALSPRPMTAWENTVLYELNVRGYTMRHPAVAEVDRGRFTGLSVNEVLQYIKALGVTAIELLPCHAFASEQFLVDKGLTNFWGYNTLNFFSPHTRYLRDNRIEEFKELVNTVHDAGLEVILDVVYNHTAEGDHLGPTLSFRGIDNLTYYRTIPVSAAHYINDTGCGNTINADHPRVQALVCDSMRYWVEEMGVDGFRFDLAPILGRTASGYDKNHTLFRKINRDPALNNVKLIAEPWDIGPGGYQLGNFPVGWGEWNDQFRDNTRRFWRGDEHRTPGFAQSLHGSAAVFESSGRKPSASVNFVTSHDGYTLNDLVSYEQRHNLANGEQNRDGHDNNHSSNFGVEGPSADPVIQHRRRRQRLNFLASLILSRGTPMLLGGDEIGHSQQGNNNAYAQDNETGWIGWTGLTLDPAFTTEVRRRLALRRHTNLLKTERYPHGQTHSRAGEPDIAWLLSDGTPVADDQWHHHRTFVMLLIDTGRKRDDPEQPIAVALLINGSFQKQLFQLPRISATKGWQCEFSSDLVEAVSSDRVLLQEQSCACVVYKHI